MNIEIKNRFTNKIILCGEYESIKDCLEKNRGTNLEGADLRGTNLEGAYLRGAYLEGAYLEGAYLRGAYLEGAYLEGAYLRGAYLRGAYLRGAYLEGAYLEGAYLEGANLRGAYLEGAYLGGAYLEGANLRGAYLEGAKNITFPILNIQGTQHHLFYMSGKISIGCENHTIDKWIKDYKTIGEEHGYTDEQIKEYFGYIKICKKLAEDNKKEKKDGLLNKKGE